MARVPRTLGEQLQSLRTSAGFSQNDLGELCGVPKPALSRYENDHVLPSIGTLRRLAEALNVSVAMLLPASDRGGSFLSDALDRRGLRARTPAEAERIVDYVQKAIQAERRRA